MIGQHMLHSLLLNLGAMENDDVKPPAFSRFRPFLTVETGIDSAEALIAVHIRSFDKKYHPYAFTIRMRIAH